jgi:hypothetical protein
MGFGYHVSKQEREREILVADRRIAVYDFVIPHADLFASIFEDSQPDLLDLMLSSQEAAEVFGLSQDDAIALNARYEVGADWLDDLAMPTDWWRRAAAIAVQITNRFGYPCSDVANAWDCLSELVHAPSCWKKYRADELRVRSRARRAIANGKAD